MKQTIKDIYLKDKRVLVRCDYNVPIKNGNILDETKIVKSLETINYLLKENCSIIIMSHLGRIKSEEDKNANSLLPIKDVLKRLLTKEIKFAPEIMSEETKNLALSLKPGEILLLENTRFLDLPEKKESTYNDDVAKFLSSLAEVFILDAFSVAHRAHTSVVGPSKYLPSALGFLVLKEQAILDELKEPVHPYTVIMGGSKVDDKLPIIKSLLPKCDNLLLSGGIANSFLYALGLNVGASLKTEDSTIIEELKNIMLEYKPKFAFPMDAVTGVSYNETINLKNINELNNDDIIKDIGSLTIQKYSQIINNSQTIFINGTMGIYEEKEFKNGTIEIFNALKNSQAKVIIGGGDTTSALNNLGFSNDFKYVLSGGGASLEYLAKDTLPGIEAISEADNIETLDL